jgi:hypothetical protein
VSGGVLGVPEVLEREWIQHAHRLIREELGKYESAARNIETLYGARIFHGVPAQHQIEEAAHDRVKEIESLFARVTFTLDHANRALDRVFSGLAPNVKQQQFKDSAVWEAILELADSYRVYFVTDDSDFHGSRRDNTPVLAETLAQECESREASVRLFAEIADCLRELKREMQVEPPDLALVMRAITATLDFDRLKEFCEGESCALHEDQVEPRVTAFLTDDKDILALSFELTYKLEAYCSGDRLVGEPFLVVVGECFYDLRTRLVSDNRTKVLFETRTPWGGRSTTVTAWGQPGSENQTIWTRVIHPTLRMPVRDQG